MLRATFRRNLYITNLSADHVWAHVLLCMLAGHVEWQMRQVLATLLFEDSGPEGTRLKRSSPVELANVSDEALEKASSKTTRLLDYRFIP